MKKASRFIAVIGAFTALMVFGSMVPAQAAYSYYESDHYAFWDQTGSRTYVTGDVDWYWDRNSIGAIVWRGQMRTGGGSYVILNQPGCLWVRIDWEKVGPNLTWPPSGTYGRTSDGWYRKCGPRLTYVYLSGVAHASTLLTGTVLCIGWSSSADPGLRRYDACKRMIIGGA